MRLTELLTALGALGGALFPALSDRLDLGHLFPQAAQMIAAVADDPLSAKAPAPWADEDPGDSLYRAAREALNSSDYKNASRLFRQLRQRYPASTYAPDSYYWEAFALYRLGETDGLRQARRLLSLQQDKYPKAATHGDAASLSTRIDGELARRGDARAAEEVAGIASGRDEDSDVRIMALNALMQMDGERATPILKRILARRDEGSTELRRRAVFILSQKRTGETESILLDAARNDPDREVKKQAVFWLSQVGTEQAVTALDSILRNSDDEELQKRALFALSQMDRGRAAQILQAYAERSDAPSEVRQQAIFWIGQHPSADNAAWLRTLYGRTTDEETKEKIIFSLAQMRDQGNERWLLDLAQNEKEPIEIRKKALFWVGQSKTVPFTDMGAMYGRIQNRELKEQLIFVFAQSGQKKEAIDKLIDIARNEKDPQLRKKALFWLGQSNDPRAADLLVEILEKP